MVENGPKQRLARWVKKFDAALSAGDADAAIVYVTDVKGAGSDVDGVDIPASQNVVATLPISALKSSKNATLAGQ